MDRAIQQWLQENAQPDPGNLKLPYTIYGCMLVLSPTAFEGLGWKDVKNEHGISDVGRLYQLIATHLKITHIAINKPIPLLEQDSQNENSIRAPSHFTPVYGDFGPASCNSPPTQADFDAAFWVNAKQNGIFQVWAPRWTMFSRGNISEKARLLTLPSVLAAVEQGKEDGRGCCAVDLYAGIGYFAFSYLKAGVDQVLCWDLNPWSIQGLRRGCEANKWTVRLLSNDSSEQSNAVDARVLMHNESNELAAERVEKLRSQLPPVRHVNCGLLPTSRGSWRTAVDVLDPDAGGWVHVHENFAIQDIDLKAEGVRQTFGDMLEEREVRIEHINRLKSYAPGVMHCVVDLYIPPSKPI